MTSTNKRILQYSELKSRALDVAYSLEDECDYELVAISRGGLSFAHLVAYNLAKTLHFFTPSRQHEFNFAATAFAVNGVKKLIFLEDVLATGRTYNAVAECMRFYKKLDWDFVPVVVEATLPLEEFPNLHFANSLVTSDWIVFPHEAEDHVTVGDRGLFREGTSMNSTKSI